MTGSELKKVAAAICWLAVSTGCDTRNAETVTPELRARGGQLFSLYCVGCHPAGENRIYPQKSLHGTDLRANGIVSAEDIVRLIRNPGRGMKRYDRDLLPDADARAIAHYILATF